MSIKIWEAYKIPIARLIEFADHFHDQMFFTVVNFLKNYIELVIENEDMMKKIKIEMKDILSYVKSDKELVFEYAISRAKRSHLTMARTFFDIDCGFIFWLDRDFVYIIPICRFQYKPPDWAENFSYQNQTDKPEGISAEEYRNRLNKWEELCLGEEKAEHNARRFYHSVVDMSPLDWINSSIELEQVLIPEKFVMNNG